MGFFVLGHFLPAGSHLLIAAAMCPSISTHSGNTQISWEPWKLGCRCSAGQGKVKPKISHQAFSFAWQ